MGSRLAWLAILGALVWSGTAEAASGDVSVGGLVEGALNDAELGPGVAVDLGLGDLLRVRADVSGRFGDGSVVQTSVGIVLAFDVVEWVPELSFYGGGRFGESAAGLAGVSAGVRRYLSLAWSCGVSAGVMWHAGEVRPQGALSLWRDFL